MRTIADLVAEHPFFTSFEPRMIELLGGCGANVRYRAGAAMFHEGEPADRFFVIRSGRVALQVHRPAGGALIIDTAEHGDVVGWSWLVPPYRWRFDGSASEEVRAVAFDATCLRARCDEDPATGYAFMTAVNRVMLHRLEAARFRLLDIYRGPHTVGSSS